MYAHNDPTLIIEPTKPHPAILVIGDGIRLNAIELAAWAESERNAQGVTRVVVVGDERDNSALFEFARSRDIDLVFMTSAEWQVRRGQFPALASRMETPIDSLKAVSDSLKLLVDSMTGAEHVVHGVVHKVTKHEGQNWAARRGNKHDGQMKWPRDSHKKRR